MNGTYEVAREAGVGRAVAGPATVSRIIRVVGMVSTSGKGGRPSIWFSR
jgi:hypothetical protein